MSRWLQWLGALHRALGLGASALLLAWFTSGMVMLFVSYPGHAPPEPSALELRAVANAQLPATAMAPFAELTLLSIDGRAAWQFLDANDRRQTRFVDGLPPPAVVGERLAIADQWTLNGSLAADFPLVRRDLDGGVIEYRSQGSGERVLSLTRSERAWLIAGPIIHWIYPTILRRHSGPWRNVVLTLATIGMLLSLSGLVFGLSLQRRAKAYWPSSPHRKRAPRLHHQLGLVFGVFAFTWTLSGALSLNPFGWSTGDGPSDDEALRYAGGAFDARRFTRPPAAALAACAGSTAPTPTTALTLTQLAGEPWYRCDAAAGTSRWTPGDREAPAQPHAPEAAVRSALRAMRSPVGALVERSEPDAYYYSTHRWEIEMPYWRAELADGSRVYVGMQSGEVQHRYERSGRYERWLFHGLHSFDYGPLLAHSWLWRALLLSLLAGGALLAATGIWWSTRRWRRPTDRE